MFCFGTGWLHRLYILDVCWASWLALTSAAAGLRDTLHVTGRWGGERNLYGSIISGHLVWHLLTEMTWVSGCVSINVHWKTLEQARKEKRLSSSPRTSPLLLISLEDIYEYLYLHCSRLINFGNSYLFSLSSEWKEKPALLLTLISIWDETRDKSLVLVKVKTLWCHGHLLSGKILFCFPYETFQ